MQKIESKFERNAVELSSNKSGDENNCRNRQKPNENNEKWNETRVAMSSCSARVPKRF